MLLLAVACGKTPVLSVGSEFTPYVAKFEQKSREYGNPVNVDNLIVQFGPMHSKEERGACEIGGDNTPSVTINQETWNKIDESEREELIFHELGHCVLRRKHRSDRDAKGHPTSIMNPYSINGKIYSQNSDAYLAELFQNRDTF